MDKGNKKNKFNSRNEFEKNINIEVIKDHAFLDQLKKDPHKAIHDKFGIDIPRHIKIMPHIEEQNTFHFVIHTSSTSGKQLSDAELANLAAGDCWF